MDEHDDRRTLIPASRARPSAHPVLVQPGQRHDESGAERAGLTVRPIVEDGRVAGFEIRCGCGNCAFVECVESPEES